MRNAALRLVPLLLLASCAQEVNPKMRSATDALVAATRGSHVEAAPRSYTPQRWAEGQWVVWKLTNAKGEVSVMRQSVVRKEAAGVWLETEIQSWHVHSVHKTLISKPPTTVEEAPDVILRTVMRSSDGGKVQVLDFREDNVASAVMKKMMKPMLSSMLAVSPPASAGREDAQVAAGSFRGCAKYNAKVTLGGQMEQEQTIWFHPAVPLHGMVKSVVKEGGTGELLDYGQRGAVSKLPDVW